MNRKPGRILSAVYLLILAGLVLFFVFGDRKIRLIVRGDDMGFCHAANVGCITAYQEGILTSAEIMPPCPKFFEAARMINENPGLDAGIHLTLSSEWENMKWRPLTRAASLVDEQGFFYPMIWPDYHYSGRQALSTSYWLLEEIEQELRAQIELALKYIPRCSHATPHMAFTTISPQVTRMAYRLVREYGLTANLRYFPLKEVDLFGDEIRSELMVEHAVQVLGNLKPGTWEYITHPARYEMYEERAWHYGAENDGLYRDAVTRALLDPRLKRVIEQRGIELIGYSDLHFWQ